MDTRQLIESLAIDLKPVGRRDGALRIALAIALGGLAVLALIAVLIGSPFEGARSLDLMATTVKLGFTLSFALLGASMLYRSARPGHDPRSSLPWLGVPVAALALVAIAELAAAPPEARLAMLLGDNPLACLASLIGLAVPVFGLLAVALRRLAPTDLPLSAMLAGIASAGTAGVLYALHCGEASPVFLLVWYGLAIAGAAIAGRLAGHRLLRW